MTKKVNTTENVRSDFTHSTICALHKNKTGIWTVKRFFCYTIGMFIARGNEK